MSSGINVSVDRILTTRNVRAWHFFDTPIEDGILTPELVERAGMGFRVRVVELTYLRPDGVTVRTGKAYTIRENNSGDGPGHWSVLGNDVSPSYSPIQPEEMLAVLKSACDAEELMAETLGTTNGGARMFLLARSPQDMTWAGDRVTPYVGVQSRNDGDGALWAFPSGIRWVCDNTMDAALGEAKGMNEGVVRIVHRGNVSAQLAKVRAQLRAAKYRHEIMRRNAEALRAKRIAKDQARGIVAELMRTVYPDPRRTSSSTAETLAEAMRVCERKRGDGINLVRAYTTRELRDAGETLYNDLNAWTLWNAMGEWGQRDLCADKSNEERLVSIVQGQAAKVAAISYNMLCAA